MILPRSSFGMILARVTGRMHPPMQQLFTLQFGYLHMHLSIQVHLDGWWLGVLIWPKMQPNAS
jgi:hypothetical protein